MPYCLFALLPYCLTAYYLVKPGQYIFVDLIEEFLVGGDLVAEHFIIDVGPEIIVPELCDFVGIKFRFFFIEISAEGKGFAFHFKNHHLVIKHQGRGKLVICQGKYLVIQALAQGETG